MNSYFKKVGEILVVTLVLLLTLTFSSNAANYRHTYQFISPEIKTLPNGKHMVKMKGTRSDAEIVGAPLLPLKTARLFVPANEEVVAIDVKTGRATVLDGPYELQYATSAHPISAKGPFPPDKPSLGIYGKDAFFPPRMSKQNSPQFLLGVQIVEIELSPIQYNPVSGKLKYFNRVEVSIITCKGVKPKNIVRYRGLKEDRLQILKTIDNPADFLAVEEEGGLVDTTSDRSAAEGTLLEVVPAAYLVITTADLVPAFQVLTDHRSSAVGGNYTTHIETIANILAAYTGGVDAAENIRNYLRDMYSNGTRYVVLGGDVDKIPFRGCHAVVGDYTDNNIPSDLYYGCLDGPWNYDGDSLWGEATDGEGGGEIDWNSELYVGRISADDSTEAANQIAKIIASETLRPNKTLLIGEKLDDTPTWGGDRMDWVYEYMGGIPMSTLYDRDYIWPKYDLLALINTSQFHWLNHLGHSNSTYNMKMGTGDVGSMTNLDSFLVYSQGCYSGNIEYPDCFGEAVTLHYSDRGAHAYIGNSRYGWYNSGSYITGASNLMHKKFVESVFTDNITKLGAANQVPKADLHTGTYRWIAFETNLLGDPAYDLKPTFCTQDSDCDDGLYCNGQEICVDGVCQEGTPVVCGDDGLFCNGQEVCDEDLDQCVSDGNPCSGDEICVEETAECVVIECTDDFDCDDGNDCTTDICNNPGTADAICVHNPVPECISGDGCCPDECNDDTDADCAVCGDSRCRGYEDYSNCPEDCEFTPPGDESECFKGVADGVCHPRKDGPNCPDCLPPIQCGNGVCEEPTENSENCPADCSFEPECSNHADCDDGFFCNGAETCVDGECLPGTSPCAEWESCDETNDQCVDTPECTSDVDCDDGDACTYDYCDAGSCSNIPIPGCNPSACFKGKPDGKCNPSKDLPGCPDCYTP